MKLADFVDSTVRDIVDSRSSELKPRGDKARGGSFGPRRWSPRPGSSPGQQRRHAGPAPPADARPAVRVGAVEVTPGQSGLNLVRDQPGITIPQIAEALKIEPNYLYRVMPKLVEDGQVKRDGQGWHPAAAA